MEAQPSPKGLLSAHGWCVAPATATARVIRDRHPPRSSHAPTAFCMSMTDTGMTTPVVLVIAGLLLLALPVGFGEVGDFPARDPPPVATSMEPSMAPAQARLVSSQRVGPDNSPLAVRAPSLNRTVIDAGQLLNLSVSITGGYKPYNITWLGLPGGGCISHNQSSFHCKVGVPTGLPTVFEVSVHVVDAIGSNATSNATTITVNPWPTVAVGISPASGGTPPFEVTLTADPLYGTPPFSYSWIFGDGLNATGALVTHTFTRLGTFVVTVWANDSLGASASGSAKIHSVTTPTVVLVATPESSVAAGASVGFSLAPSGGLGPFTYLWSGLPSFCPPIIVENTSVVSCSGAKPGTYTVTVELTDSLLQTANASVTLTVTAPTSAWEYVAIGALALALALAAVLVLQLIRYRRERPPARAIRPADLPSPP